MQIVVQAVRRNTMPASAIATRKMLFVGRTIRPHNMKSASLSMEYVSLIVVVPAKPVSALVRGNRAAIPRCVTPRVVTFITSVANTGRPASASPKDWNARTAAQIEIPGRPIIVFVLRSSYDKTHCGAPLAREEISVSLRRTRNERLHFPEPLEK